MALKYFEVIVESLKNISETPLDSVEIIFNDNSLFWNGSTKFW